MEAESRKQPPRHWHALAADEVVDALETSSATGLDDAEVLRRKALHGPNALPAPKRRSLLARVVAQFSDVTVIALLVAAAIAIALGIPASGSLLGRFGDAVAIGLIALLNAVIGLVQEGKAEKALRTLEDLSAPQAWVRRAGQRLQIPAQELVPGDVVLLAEGDRIPADLRLHATHDLSVSEAALTGESEPVAKKHDDSHPEEKSLAERTNMAYSGTLVARGRGEGVVIATALHTELGRLSALLASVEAPTTPLQERLRRFGLWVVLASLAAGALVFVIGFARHQATLGVLALTGISLAVAAIPEGLPAITTIVLALGVQRMAKRHAVVRKLAAVEALGSADIICTDKTGTLTQNHMRVRRLATRFGEYSISEDAQSFTQTRGTKTVDPRTFDIHSAAEIMRAARGAHYSSATQEYSGDPTDRALLELAVGVGMSEPPRVVAEAPFSTTRKRASVCVKDAQGELHVLSHGAPESILGQCTRILRGDHSEHPLEDDDVTWLHATIDAWASLGFRVLALARRRLRAEPERSSVEAMECDLTLVGLVGLSDPPRPQVAEALARASEAGLRTVMITGDHPRTAAAIASEIGLEVPAGGIVHGPQLERMSSQELGDRSGSIRVIARATAEVKLRFVNALLARGHTVAMTGDGVNDAPALKAASIGVAMGRQGTDVAREAADLVLMDDNYATIVAAVEEGRIIFANIRRFVVFLLAANTGLVVAVFVASVLGWPPLLLPIQILWINLITNGLPALALGMEPAHGSPLARGPKRERLVRPEDVRFLLQYGLWMAVVGLLVFSTYLRISIEYARTMSFTVLALAPLFHALGSRSREISFFRLNPFENYRLLGAFGAALALQAIALVVPSLHAVFHTTRIAPRDIAIALLASSTCLLLSEIEKALRFSPASVAAAALRRVPERTQPLRRRQRPRPSRWRRATRSGS